MTPVVPAHLARRESPYLQDPEETFSKPLGSADGPLWVRPGSQAMLTVSQARSRELRLGVAGPMSEPFEPHPYGAYGAYGAYQVPPPPPRRHRGRTALGLAATAVVALAAGAGVG